MEDCESKKFIGKLVTEFTYDDETGGIVIVEDDLNAWCAECDTPLFKDGLLYQILKAHLERFLHRPLKTEEELTVQSKRKGVTYERSDTIH